MYYGLIILSVVMFGGGFAFNNGYRKIRGSSIKISLQFSLIGGLAGLLILLLLNGFRLEFTPFTLLMALLSTANSLVLTYCGFKALDKINLSLYSVFMMLGGMLLPFLQGLIFYGEDMTLAKGACLALIFAALLLTFERGERRRGTVYYVIVFLLNGMAGVLSKLFTSAPYEKASAAGYSILSGICSIVICSLLLLIFFRKRDGTPKIGLPDTGLCIGSCALNRVANYILLIALLHVETSVQYPMVTGGTMIVSTLICFFGKNRPKKRELLSVALAFLAMLSLFIIPI